ncbi:MAG: mechanosensitive ion channel domain-containing protein [Nostocaceae cyanobacterium]|nr:mechanosensitive ion channel domain-containing protein [Nostocaceae cyanobacterium]
MNFSEQILQDFHNEEIQSILLRTAIFFGFILLSFLIGKFTPNLLKLFLYQFLPQRLAAIYNNLIEPVSYPLQVAGTLILIYLSLDWIKPYERVYQFFLFFIELAIVSSITWLASRLFHYLIRQYGINFIQKLGRGADELLLVFETIFNVSIGMIAVLTFAKDRFDLFGLVAGLGIGGLAIAFAAQRTLEQFIGTIVLYLDRPFVPGEYIRIPASQQFQEEFFGRVESIGLRSTKIRIAAKSTLLIVPNSILANLEIENITRGKKVMVLLYFNFTKKLDEREQAIVKQIIKEDTDSLFGIDPGSTNVDLLNDNQDNTKVRVTFFILGSSESSIQLRKRLLELANKKISKELTKYGIIFNIEEPNIYVESPITI